MLTQQKRAAGGFMGLFIYFVKKKSKKKNL